MNVREALKIVKVGVTTYYAWRKEKLDLWKESLRKK